MDFKSKFIVLAIIVAMAAISFIPVSAAIAEVNGMGTVSSVDNTLNTVTITKEYQFSTSYSESEPISEWTKSEIVSSVTGIVPDQSAFETFNVGDPVRYIILGGDGGTYLGIAKITEVSPKAVVTDIIGDPNRIIFRPLEGGYVLSTSALTKCTDCSGTICIASSSDIKVVKSGETIAEKNLLPGGIYTYMAEDPLEYDIYVKFIKGETSSDKCQSSASFAQVTGPQAVSVYEIHITEGVLPLGPGPVVLNPTPPLGSPGFGFITGIIAVFGVLLLVRRK